MAFIKEYLIIGAKSPSFPQTPTPLESRVCLVIDASGSSRGTDSGRKVLLNEEGMGSAGSVDTAQVPRGRKCSLK